MTRFLRELALLLGASRVHGPKAKALTHKSVVRQIAEICALRVGLGRLSAQEYYDYGLYDDERFPWQAKKQFFGRAMEMNLVDVLGTGDWHAIAWDKAITNTILESAGIPTAPILAVYDHARYLGATPCFQKEDEVSRFLRADIRYPFVCKPIWGISGHSISAVDRLDSERDVLILAGGDEIPVEMFVKGLLGPRPPLSRPPTRGVLFQERLSPHPIIAAACGNRICSLRLIVLMTEEGPQLFRGYWKIAAGTNFIDNFQRGLSGNLVATLDLDSGLVKRCVTKGASRPEFVNVHPDTGQVLTGITLPAWKETVDLTKRAALLMPGLRMQAWDVAICPDGPVFLEVNVIGGFNLPQVADGAGIYDAELRGYLKKFGFG